MTEQANSEANPTTEEPTPNAKPTYEELERQNKGLQRQGQRYRDQLAMGIQNDGISREVELSRNAINEFAELLKNSPLMDDTTKEKIEETQGKMARVQKDLAGETTLRSEIATTLTDANLDWDAPEQEVLRTHFETGNADKVREILTEIQRKTSESDLDAVIEARVQAKLKERGIPVDTGDSSGGTPPEGKEAILRGIEKGELSPQEAMRQAIALANST